MVAGLIASNTDNNKGIPAIGFNCRIAKTSFDKNDMLKMAKDGVKVINISQDWDDWEERGKEYQELIDELVEDYGVTVVAAAGNDDSYEYKYPASYDNVISVTSVGHEFDYGTTFKGQQFGWKDCHRKYLHSTRSVTSHQHNDKVDICAPGYNIVTLCHPNTWKSSGKPTGQLYNVQEGSSFAAAIVSGVCALMYSVNPDLTPAEVENIIKSTAVDIYQIPENQPFMGMLGAGRIDAYAAVKMALEYKQPFEPITDSVFEEAGNAVSIFPNPTNGPFNITGTKYHDQVLVYSVAGKLVKETYTSSSRETFSIRELDPGMYIVIVIRNNHPVCQQKIIKM
jgi:subtilisin family serine protease